MDELAENQFQQKLDNMYIDSLWETYQKEFTDTVPDLDGQYELSDSEEKEETIICPSQIIELMEELDKEDTTEQVIVLDTAEKIFQFMTVDVHK